MFQLARVFLWTLIVWMNVATLFSKELFVDAARGNDGSPGVSRETAFATIQKGVDAMTPGDTLTILPGVYFEHVLMRNTGREDARLLIRADKIQKGRVVLSGSQPAFRQGKVVWKLEDASLGLYSAAFPHRPFRLSEDGNDLFAYDDLDGLKRFRSWLDGKPSDYPGPSQGFAWVKSEEKLYVRLHASGRYGKPDPNGRSVSTSPTYSGLKNEPGLGPDYGIAVWPKPNGTSAWLTIEGITFETPALCGVNTSGCDLVVRNCWFIGCRSGVQGSMQNKDQKDGADRVTVEHCEYHQFPAFDDMAEVIRLYENDAWRGDRTTLNQKIYWWHRKNKGTGMWAYENGIVLKAGADWVVRKNWIHDAFEAITGGGGTWSRNLRVEENLIERMIDNAFETEDHAQGFQARSNFIVDVFEPISWQPMEGDPYPGDVLMEENRIYVTPERWDLWSRVGAAPGIFKMGQEKAPRPKSGEPWIPARAPGLGFLAKNNYVFAPGHRLITTVQPQMRSFENFFIQNNVFAVSNDSSGFTNDSRGVNFEKNTLAFHAPSSGRSLEIMAGKEGQTIPENNWSAWLASEEGKKAFGPGWNGAQKGWTLPVVGREVGPIQD